jgi:hypothetical protein
LDSGVSGGELPVNVGLVCVSLCIPGVNFGLESWEITNAAIEALAREGGEFNFRSD